jgi:diguanylate cyclase (GGDEF)-like protein
VRLSQGRQRISGRHHAEFVAAADGLVLAVVRDTTASKLLNEKLRQLAYSDPLTGLPNRSALYRELGKSLKGDPAAPIAPTSIALFDLDGFKEVNDTMGHSCGDKLLKEVARRWTAVIGEGPRIYRLGGDEFVALVSNCGDPREIAEIAGTMLQALDKPFDIAAPWFSSVRAPALPSPLPTGPTSRS